MLGGDLKSKTIKRLSSSNIALYSVLDELDLSEYENRRRALVLYH